MFLSKCCTFPIIYNQSNPLALGEVATTTLTFTFHLYTGSEVMSMHFTSGCRK